MSDLPPTPPRFEQIIRKLLAKELGVEHPRQFQIDAIFHLVFRKVGMMYLICKTGEGKSLVMMGTAVALRGVTVVMGPLQGLGTDQANKSKRIERGIESYHADEFRDADRAKLDLRLRSFSKRHKLAC